MRTIKILLIVIITQQIFAQKEIKPDAQARKKLCTFFSNFSEVKLNPFVENKISGGELIRFGIRHVFINNKKIIEKIGNTIQGRLHKQYVEDAVKKYFGNVSISHQSIYDTINSAKYELKGNYYIIPYAYDIIDEVEHNFSYLSNLFNFGNDLYKALVDDITMSYEYSNGFLYQSPEMIRKKTDNIESVKMNCIIKKVKGDGKDRFILIEYLPAVK